jgi:threonine aldolase
MDKVRVEKTVSASKPSRPPVMADFGVTAASCNRFLVGDGPRKIEELLSTIPATTVMDYYGAGGVVTDLEAEVASLLGKPSALFLPTGTMAQQATLRVHADRRSSKSIVFHPCCHLETHEERGYQRLHGLFGVPVGSRHEPLTLANLENVREPVAALVLELPQRDLGGTLPTWKELSAQVSWARERGAAVHLDGARLWEAAPYYAKSQQKSLADIAALFDSVYVSFYKGLGAIAGCCVAGETDVIDELSVWRTRHGGRTFMMWPYAASALTVLRERPALMATYYRRAQAIARELRKIDGVDVLPERVQSPMMHLRLSGSVKQIRQRVRDIAKKQQIMTFSRPYTSEGPNLQRFEFQVGRATMDFTPREVARLVAQLVGADSIR